MISLTINDTRIEVEAGTTVLAAARQAGIDIPSLCYHKDLRPYGACRVCLVETISGGRPGIQASCVYEATEGLVVTTDTERVQRSRRIILELLLARCPDAAPIKELAERYGVTTPRIGHKDPDNCILCGLCERACAEVSQRDAISFSRRSVQRAVDTPFNRISERCIGCGACAYVCPTKTIKIENAQD